MTNVPNDDVIWNIGGCWEDHAAMLPTWHRSLFGRGSGGMPVCYSLTYGQYTAEEEIQAGQHLHRVTRNLKLPFS